jgi:hypothetical protein
VGGVTAWRLSLGSMHAYPSGNHPPRSGDSPWDRWSSIASQAIVAHEGCVGKLETWLWITCVSTSWPIQCWSWQWWVWLAPVLHCCTLPVLALDWPQRQSRLKPRHAHLTSALRSPTRLDPETKVAIAILLCHGEYHHAGWPCQIPTSGTPRREELPRPHT